MQNKDIAYWDNNECLAHIEKLKSMRTHLRKKERAIKAKEQALYSMPEVGASDLRHLESNLQKFLPASSVPGNVGPKDAVVWPFWYSMDFDFGTDPECSINTRQDQNFQVSQEAAFMIMAISRSSFAKDTAGSLGPWKITLKDAQSSRQLNDLQGLPFQALGTRSNPTIFPTPYFLFPNAKFNVEMSGLLTPAEAFTTKGEGKHQITFFGYRMRVEDAQNVLSTIYG